MATGPSHYCAAEALVEQARGIEDADARRDLIAAAQVHATLALAAATAELGAHEGPGGGSATGRSNADTTAWIEAGAVGAA